MLQSVMTAGTGLSSEQTRLDTIANNIANVNTNGFKATTVDFKDALYTTMLSPIAGDNQNALTKGVGSLVGATYKDFDQGTIKNTGSKLDFVIQGDGFFTLKTDTGDTVYTRNGSFSVSHETGGNYLVNSEGYYVMDTNGNKIPVTNDGKNLTVSSDGVLTDNNQEVAQLNVVNFANSEGLEEAGKSDYRSTANSGAITTATGTVVQGKLEGSNVNLAQEMTLLIRTQRAFSLASRALTQADQMDGLANNMRNG
jgi:flagellar basal-body rod protein FlgG